MFRQETLIFNNGINTSLIVYDTFKKAGFNIRHLDNTATKKQRSETLDGSRIRCYFNLS